MKLQLLSGNNYSTHNARFQLAQYLALIICGRPFVPYPKFGSEEENNSFHWHLDDGNNWWLNFDETDKEFKTFRIEYRYNNESNSAEERLFNWLSFKYPVIKLKS